MVEKKTDSAGQPALEGIMEAPIILADGFSGVMIGNGVVKLNIFSDMYDPVTERVRRRCTLQMVSSVPALIQIHQALSDLLAGWEEEGTIRRAEGGR